MQRKTTQHDSNLTSASSRVHMIHTTSPLESDQSPSEALLICGNTTHPQMIKEMLPLTIGSEEFALHTLKNFFLPIQPLSLKCPFKSILNGLGGGRVVPKDRERTQALKLQASVPCWLLQFSCSADEWGNKNWPLFDGTELCLAARKITVRTI